MNFTFRGYNLLILLLCLWITACTTISKQIQEAGNATGSSYPAAQANNPELQKPLVVNLAQYKSVQTRAHQRGDIAIALAASGGGYRAANLTLGVLMGLESVHSSSLKGNLLQEVDYYSTVSGGGFGVGYYLAQLQTYSMLNKHSSSFSLHRAVNQMLNDETENPLRMDLAEHLFFGEKRGLGLEKKLNARILTTPEGGLRMGNVFIPRASNQSVQLPYWITNSTIYQNAAILPFSPDILSSYRVIGYYHNARLNYLHERFNNPWYAAEMPMAVGMTASATVPFATPATTLVTKGCGNQCYLQLYDGGLADNLGIYTALSLLLQDKAKTKILFIVDAYKGDTQPYSQLSTPPDTAPLILRVMTIGTDSTREHLKPNIQYLGRDLLCMSGAKNVVVIYLDISRYPEAQQVGTQLTMTAQHQKMLVRIGQEIVAHDPTIKTIISQLERGKLTLGQCKKSGLL